MSKNKSLMFSGGIYSVCKREEHLLMNVTIVDRLFLRISRQWNYVSQKFEFRARFLVTDFCFCFSWYQKFQAKISTKMFHWMQFSSKHGVQLRADFIKNTQQQWNRIIFPYCWMIAVVHASFVATALKPKTLWQNFAIAQSVCINNGATYNWQEL